MYEKYKVFMNVPLVFWLHEGTVYCSFCSFLDEELKTVSHLQVRAKVWNSTAVFLA